MTAKIGGGASDLSAALWVSAMPSSSRFSGPVALLLPPIDEVVRRHIDKGEGDMVWKWGVKSGPGSRWEGR